MSQKMTSFWRQSAAWVPLDGIEDTKCRWWYRSPDVRTIFQTRSDLGYVKSIQIESRKVLSNPKEKSKLLSSWCGIKVMCPCQLRSCSKATPTRSNDSLFCTDAPFIKMGWILVDFLCDSEHDWVLEEFTGLDSWYPSLQLFKDLLKETCA